MPEGHTLHALAGRVHHAFAGTAVATSSPQGRFEDGAALLDGRVMLEASAWGKHLFAEFGGDAWLHVHLGLIGKMSVQQHRRRTAPGAPLLTKPFLRCLFVLEGFRRRADLEARMDWAGKDRVLVYERQVE